MKEEKIKYRSALESAMAYLVGTQQIVDYQEVFAKVQGSKGTFSDYRSGKKPMSENFVRKFKECFDVDLDEFKEEDGYKWPQNKKPSEPEGLMLNEPAANYGVAAETPLINESMLETLVVFLIRIRQGLYDGRNETEVIELFWRERTQRILDRAKNTHTEKRTKGKVKKNR